MIKLAKIIVNNDIVLHEINEKYIDALYEMLSDKDTARYIIPKTHSSIDDTKEFYNKIQSQKQENKSIYLGIFKVDEDKLMGFMREGLLRRYSYNERTGEIEDRLIYSRIKGESNNVQKN